MSSHKDSRDTLWRQATSGVFHQPEIGHHHEDDEMRSPSIYFSRLQDVDIKLVPLTIELSYFVFGGGVHDYRHETLARCFVYLWLEKVHIFLIFPSPKVYTLFMIDHTLYKSRVKTFKSVSIWCYYMKLICLCIQLWYKIIHCNDWTFPSHHPLSSKQIAIFILKNWFLSFLLHLFSNTFLKGI